MENKITKEQKVFYSYLLYLLFSLYGIITIHYYLECYNIIVSWANLFFVFSMLGLSGAIIGISITYIMIVWDTIKPITTAMQKEKNK